MLLCFCVYLRTNRFLCHFLHYLISFYNIDLTLCNPTCHYIYHQFNIRQITHCLHSFYVFCVYLRTISDLCHLLRKVVGFCNRDEKFLQRGTDWGFKWSGLGRVFKGINSHNIKKSMTDYYSSTLKLHRNPTTVNPSNTRSQSYIYIYVCICKYIYKCIYFCAVRKLISPQIMSSTGICSRWTVLSASWSRCSRLTHIAS